MKTNLTATIQLAYKYQADDPHGALATAVYRLQRMLTEGKCSAWRVLSKEGVELAKGP